MTIDYFQIFEKQLKGDYNIIMKEYQDYRDIMFDQNAQCPLDKKEPLEKEFTDKGFKMFCKKSKKEYFVEVEMPQIKNIDEVYEKTNYDFTVLVNKLKSNILKMNMDLVSNMEMEKETEQLLKELREEESKKENIEKIYNFYKNKYEEITLKRKTILSKMLETKKKKHDIYKKCEPLSTNIVKELGEIFKTEGIPIVTRLTQLEKKYNVKNMKFWFMWFDEVKNYLTLLKEKRELEKENEVLDNEKKNIIEKFILAPPKIISKKE